MQGWMQKLEQWAGGGSGGEKRVQTFRWLIIIGLAGVAIMVINSYLTIKEVEPLEEAQASVDRTLKQTFLGKEPTKSPFQEYEMLYEQKLKETLESIVGVGEVDVMVTIESTEEIVVEHNFRDSQQVTNEKDQHGSTRHITELNRSGDVVLYEASGDQTPVIRKTINPKIRGVVIVAKGAENQTVKMLIFDAVRKGLDVPAHRIHVAPRKR